MRFGIDQLDRTAKGGVLTAFAPVVIDDPPFEIGGDPLPCRKITERELGNPLASSQPEEKGRFPDRRTTLSSSE